ncbi:hypothetical protein L6452_39459 [Arctium lappa]|uniref:Uncharacterized protein n=1 Tax=Arctium lappa TaxID=4217 RepID=A0ACB8XRQ9_ARCLA|nr:hypothetical protein L6452_39459 [Arctium lappa]
MYNQGNYQQFGHRLPVLPSPPPFQQGHPASQHPITQQGHPSVPPHAGQAGPSPYALASSASMQLGPPVSVPPSGMLSSSQSYLIPPPPAPTHAHVSTSTPHSYSAAPQNSNWNQNQHISPPIPPPGRHLTPRIPPPPPQGHHFYRVPAPPLLPGGIRGIQQAPPLLPPPPTPSYFTPAPFGSFVQPGHESSLGHLPPPPPPPPPPPSSPPPGPPPLPPSSPPPNSPLRPSSESLSTAAELGPTSRKLSVVDMVASGVIDRTNGAGHIDNDTLRHDDGMKCTAPNDSATSVKGTSDFNITSDIPLPPPRPRDEKIVRKIEVLCQYIAKNGHEFEDMTRQKEVDNPEFEFLFGGAPGSEAAISHEYFKWMKKNCSSSELLEGRHNRNISLEPSGVGSSGQPVDSMHASISHSPAGSDMDMEDDITQPEEPRIGKSFGSAKNEPTSISNEVDITVEEHDRHACDLEHMSHKDATDRNLSCPGSSGVIEQGANLSQDGLQFEKSSMKVGVSDSDWSLDSKAEHHNITLYQEMNQSGASNAAEVKSSEVPGEIIRGTSPFRLIQGYASDDSSENDSEPHLENISPGAVSLQIKEGTTGLDALQTATESKDSSELDKGLGSLSVPVVEGSLNTSKFPEPSTRTEDLEEKTGSYLVREQVEQDGNGRYSQTFVDGGASIMDFKQNNRLEDDDTAGSKNGGALKEDRNAKLEVDEFGRMVKAGASDSDSDDYTRRRGKRGRSRSRSRSPIGRRRRSPWRRRENRSRSRSWSPKKRSRSRSPYRYGGGASGDWTRRNISHLPVCFDFRRGKCFRGESCRYLHDSEKSEESRRYKNKQQYQEVPDRLKNSGKLVPEKDEVDSEEMLLYQDVDKGSERIKEEFVEPAGHSAAVVSSHETLDVGKLVGNVPAAFLTDVDGEKLLGIENLQSQANLSGPLLQNSNDQLQPHTEHPATDQRSAISGQLSIDERPLNQTPPAEAQLPLPPPSQSSHAPIHSQPPREYNVMPTSNYSSHSASAEIYPPYQAPLSSEHPEVSVPPASSWNPLPPPPPPPPRPQLGGPLSQYQQTQLPPRMNYPFQAFVRPYPPELPTHSLAGESHLGTYPPALESQRPLPHTEDFRPRTFPVNYPIPQQPGGPRIFGEENFPRAPSPNLVSSNSNSQGDIHPHSLRFSREPPTGIMQSFSGESIPPGGIPVPSSEGHAYMSRYSLKNPVADSISTLGEPGKINLRYPTDFPDGGQVSGISDFGRSRISSHYNPYASTFDQPLSTKFSSGAFSQDTGTSYSHNYGVSIGQNHTPDEGKGVGGISSRNMNISPTSMHYFARNIPRSGGDQYDPLFDSIEPYSFRKSDHGNKIEGTDIPDMLRLSGSNKLLDLEENSKHKEVAIAASTSVENDEFGETADAEVGAVENDSPSSPIDLPDVAQGEIEIDQVKNPGKTKKSKDSRSMKLFKVALADFVKEVLKPSWRQGNMSKEAFKTIVKKTVDKVSGAMKKHQLPKSQAKINQYIDSSQRKLTKLVMGYVDKYVKV